jgi:hypothetical protein
MDSSKLTTWQFVAEVVKIFKIPSSGRTPEVKKFLHACGSLYKKWLQEQGTGASNSAIQTAIQRLNTEVSAETGVALEDTFAVSDESCPSELSVTDVYSQALVDSLESTTDAEMSAQSQALAFLLTIGHFTSVNDEFGFELFDYNGTMKGGRRFRKQSGGGLKESLLNLGKQVCGLFTGRFSAAEESAAVSVDKAAAVISTPGYFDSILNLPNLSAAGIVLGGSGDVFVRLATNLVGKLDAVLPSPATSFGNIFLFGKNVAGLMGSLIWVAPKIVCLLFLWKVVMVLREYMFEVGVSTAMQIKESIPSNERLKEELKKRLTEELKKQGNMSGLLQGLTKRVCSVLGVNSTKAAPVQAALQEVVAAADKKSDALKTSLRSAAGTGLETSVSEASKATVDVKAVEGETLSDEMIEEVVVQALATLDKRGVFTGQKRKANGSGSGSAAANAQRQANLNADTEVEEEVEKVNQAKNEKVAAEALAMLASPPAQAPQPAASAPRKGRSGQKQKGGTRKNNRKTRQRQKQKQKQKKSRKQKKRSTKKRN